MTKRPCRAAKAARISVSQARRGVGTRGLTTWRAPACRACRAGETSHRPRSLRKSRQSLRGQNDAAERRTLLVETAQHRPCSSATWLTSPAFLLEARSHPGARWADMQLAARRSAQRWPLCSARASQQSPPRPSRSQYTPVQRQLLFVAGLNGAGLGQRLDDVDGALEEPAQTTGASAQDSVKRRTAMATHASMTSADDMAAIARS